MTTEHERATKVNDTCQCCEKHVLPNMKLQTVSSVCFVPKKLSFHVKHVNSTIVNLANKYKQDGINFIAISSNDVENYPEDSPKLMKVNAVENNYVFPYLYDESQKIAKSYDAACTPDFYLYDSDLLLVYRGQLDDSRPGNGLSCDGKDISNAIECLINEKENTQIQKPSIGWNIKWK